MWALSTWSLWGVCALFGVAAVVIAVFGTWLTGVAERLARDTGLGQAVFGAVFLGGATSLPGITTSVTAALNGQAELAVSNGIGGIAAQTVFLAIADASYRRINLEHAAASVANLMQGALLVMLLALPLLGMASPPFTILGAHPVSYLIPALYVFGIRLLNRAQTTPMWAAEQTAETVNEPKPEQVKGRSLAATWLKFVGLAAVVGVAGWVVATTGGEIAARTALSESVVGAYLTAVATSLPELVTSIAAVRRGALTLAVGDIIGGNCFDVLFVAAADFAYPEGSIYDAVGEREQFVIALTIMMTGTLLLGLLSREKRGIANIGFESFLVIMLYIGSLALLLVSGGQ